MSLRSPSTRRKRLLPLLIAAALAFAFVVRPFFAAIFWSLVLAIVLAAPYRLVLRLCGGRASLAAATTLLLALAIVGVPLVLIGGSLLRQASELYADLASGRIDVGAYALRVAEALPAWALSTLQNAGIADLASLREKLSASGVAAGRLAATHLIAFSLDAFDLALSTGVMLYLLFFLLRDGPWLAARLEAAFPTARQDTRFLFERFVTVIRATVKGGVTMAAAQGVLGGAMLAALGVGRPLFWGVVFGVLSMLPAVGASLLWAPIAVYFLATGAVAKGLVLIGFGVVVLTVVDNTLRPLLVGKDTQLPSYLVLVSTLGGIAAFGISGLIIGPVVAATLIALWDLFSGLSAPPRAGAEDRVSRLPGRRHAPGPRDSRPTRD